MVNFSRKLESQMIPEWRDAFLDYRQLKKNIKSVKSSRPAGENATAGFSLIAPVRYVATQLSRRHRNISIQVEEDQDNVELVHSREDEVKLFFERLDNEFQKVNGFFEGKEAEFVERGDMLAKQLQILIDFKNILHDPRSFHKNTESDSSHDAGTPSQHSSPSTIPEIETETDEGTPDVGTLPARTNEMVRVLERNGVSFIGTPRTKAKKKGKPITRAIHIDIPATTPSRTIVAVTSVIWEDIVNISAAPKKEGGHLITTKKIQRAEKMIRNAYFELYKGIGHLNTFRSLNMEGFRKILKKFDKVANRQESETYLQKVKGSGFVTSDKVVRLGDEVECIFTEHFAEKDRKKAMKFLRPRQQKDSHMITFLVGLFTGCFVTMFSVYVVLSNVSGIFSNKKGDPTGYIETMYPIFGMFALISLHMFMYGCNLYAWKRTRINHNFIFEFSPNTALKHTDAFLISAALMTIIVGAMVIHIVLVAAGISPRHVDKLPGILLLVFVVLLLCPFNILYRSTRWCFLRVLRKIVLAPLYRVYMVDFFLADQITSQIPLMRYMEFVSCFFIVGGFGFKSNSHTICTNSMHYRQLAYIISLAPYFWRTVQCLRRYMEEGYDINHIANTCKYVSTLVAASARLKYTVNPTATWMGVVIFTSTSATVFQLYWDFVMDWGVFCKNSKNRWLRDDLILKKKRIYYFSIALNFVLRLAWIQTIIQINFGNLVHNRMFDFLMASLEITRRGQWNYYRVENEHLNNVGKFRAVKAVPLPFREIDSD